PQQTIEKLAGMFDVLVPHLIEVYEETAAATDQICDAPTIELLEEATRKLERHRRWGSAVLDRLCDGGEARERRRARVAEIRDRLVACGGVTGTLPGDATS